MPFILIKLMCTRWYPACKHQLQFIHIIFFNAPSFTLFYTIPNQITKKNLKLLGQFISFIFGPNWVLVNLENPNIWYFQTIKYLDKLSNPSSQFFALHILV